MTLPTSPLLVVSCPSRLEVTFWVRIKGIQGIVFPAEDFRKKKNTVTNTFLLALFDRPYFARLDLRSTQLHKKNNLVRSTKLKM